MWARMICLLPIAAMMSTVNISEEIKMEGDLQYELERLLSKNMQAIKIIYNKKLNLKINTSYPAGSNLWTIFDGILERYHLLIDILPKDGTIAFKLKEGSAWMHKS